MDSSDAAQGKFIGNMSMAMIALWLVALVFFVAAGWYGAGMNSDAAATTPPAAEAPATPAPAQ